MLFYNNNEKRILIYTIYIIYLQMLDYLKLLAPYIQYSTINI